jgi:hypothetical protein
MSSVAGVETGVSEIPFMADLSRIRQMARLLPGPLPAAVNGIRVAASIRPNKFVIAGGDESAVTMPRTAFQVVYPDCTVMIDSGMDHETAARARCRAPDRADAFPRRPCRWRHSRQ